MEKRTKYEKLLHLIEKRQMISIEICRKRLPEISSGTFYSTMNKLSGHNLVKKIPQLVGTRRMAYQKTNEYTIGKATKILRKEPTKPLQTNEEFAVSTPIVKEEQETVHEAKRRIHNLAEEIAIENREIPERKTRITDLKGRISSLESYLDEIETRMQELISHQRA